jgi:hypothetical protein
MSLGCMLLAAVARSLRLSEMQACYLPAPPGVVSGLRLHHWPQPNAKQTNNALIRFVEIQPVPQLPDGALREVSVVSFETVLLGLTGNTPCGKATIRYRRLDPERDLAPEHSKYTWKKLASLRYILPALILLNDALSSQPIDDRRYCCVRVVWELRQVQPRCGCTGPTTSPESCSLRASLPLQPVNWCPAGYFTEPPRGRWRNFPL